MAFGNHLEATLTWTSSSASFQSKLYYTNTGETPSLDNITQVADFIRAKINTAMLAAIPPYVTFQPVVLRVRGGAEDLEDTSTEPGSPGVFVDGGTPVIGVENDVLPEGDQVVIQMRTGKAGRSKRGRIFLPFIPESLVDNSTLNATGLPKYKAIATRFAQEINMEDLGTLVPVRKDYKNQILEPVTHCRVVSEICTRRDRRVPKRPVAFRAPAV